jgi:beta-barrel assembly-enhancing protease
MKGRGIAMKQKKMHWKRAIAGGTIVAAAIMLALVPMNMGGCSAGSLGDAVGGAVGGTTGNLISAGGKAAQAASLGPAQENAMGQSVSVAIVNQYGLDPDESLNRYVALVGSAVVSTSPRPDIAFVFGVLNSDQVNAFAGPGGYIMITRGAILRMQDESELAGVLAHEIGHVIDQHGLRAMKQAGMLDAGLTAAKSNDQIAKWGQATDSVVDVVLKKGYSRDQEGRADLLGVDYVIAAGYDPEGYHRFLQRMATASASGGSGSIMSTHPGLADRAMRVAAKIKEKGSPAGATLADRFKKNVPKAKPAA